MLYTCIYTFCEIQALYCAVQMFGRVNVWQIAENKSIAAKRQKTICQMCPLYGIYDLLVSSMQDSILSH